MQVIVDDAVVDGVHTTFASTPLAAEVEISASVISDATVVASDVAFSWMLNVTCSVVVPQPVSVVHDCTPLVHAHDRH